MASIHLDGPGTGWRVLRLSPNGTLNKLEASATVSSASTARLQKSGFSQVPHWQLHCCGRFTAPLMAPVFMFGRTVLEATTPALANLKM